jgi:hypothetical protein
VKSNKRLHGAADLLLMAGLILTACGTPTPSAQTVPTKAPTMPTVAEGCPVATAGTQLLVNEVHGYYLLYPVGYSVERPNEFEIVLVVGSLLNVEQPHTYIEVQEADRRTAAQVADKLVADVEGFAIDRSSVRSAAKKLSCWTTCLARTPTGRS